MQVNRTRFKGMVRVLFKLLILCSSVFLVGNYFPVIMILKTIVLH